MAANKKTDKIDLSRGATVLTFGDVFKVRRRVIEEQEDGCTIIVIVLQDVESFRVEEKEIQKMDQFEKKVQAIDGGMVDQELKKIRKNKDGSDSDFDVPPTDFNG